MTLSRRAGGWLYQEADSLTPADIDFTVVSEAQPTEEQLADLRFAWLAVKHVKSNAITVAKGGRLLGMGSGQPNRVESVRIALKKAGDEAKVGVSSDWAITLLDSRAISRAGRSGGAPSLCNDASLHGRLAHRWFLTHRSVAALTSH